MYNYEVNNLQKQVIKNKSDYLHLYLSASDISIHHPSRYTTTDIHLL